MPVPAPPVLSAAEVSTLLNPARLIDTLAEVLASNVVAPPRHHHPFAIGGDADQGMLLLMPAWQPGGLMGVKVASVVPGNAAAGLPSVIGSYLLLDATTGVPLLVADAAALTARRTACVAALAASRLARADSTSLLVVGAGAIAAELVATYRAVFALRHVAVWARRADAAAAVAEQYGATVVTDLKAAVRGADIIACATGATVPLVEGRWLQPGTHLDLLGGFTSTMREVDAEVIVRAQVFVDTREALAAGDLATPIADGQWSADQLAGDLPALLRGGIDGRTSPAQITLFKSVGTAAADLAAGALLWRSLQKHSSVASASQ